MKKLFIQLLKFGFVGGLCFVIDFGLLVFLTDVVNVNYLISSMISFSISVIANYILSVIFVFDVDKSKNKARNFILFVFFSVVGLGINQLIMWISVEVIEINYMVAKIISTMIVMCFNFVTRKMFLEDKKFN